MTILDHLKEDHSPKIIEGLKTTAAIIEALEEDGFDTYWCGHIATPPTGNKIVICNNPPKPLVLFVTSNIVWVLNKSGKLLGRFDITEPNSLNALAAFAGQENHTEIESSELPNNHLRSSLLVLEHEYQDIRRQWGIAWWNKTKTTAN